MAQVRSTVGELHKPRVPREPQRRGGRPRKSLKGDNLKATSWRTWPGKGWGRIIQAEEAVGANPLQPFPPSCDRTCIFGELRFKVRVEVM